MTLEQITLRDWLAGQALIGLGTWSPVTGTHPDMELAWQEDRAAKAKWAYAQAEAMLAARNLTAQSKPTAEPPQPAPSLSNQAPSA
jgi:hypothetical protein